jgi:hypothetical protein
MPIYPKPNLQIPGYWNAFGHSYLENQLGTADQTGRPDGIFRDITDVEFNNWRNYAVTGSVLMVQGVSQGGYARMLQAVPGVVRGAPYVSNGGGAILGWGINDMGKQGTGSTFQNAFIDSLRTMISRWRAATVRENTDASISYGAGFTLASNSEEWTSGTSYRTATSTTNANFTITLPSDYDGSPVVLCFNGITNGGSGTFSGTAGVTGTFNTSNIIPASAVSHAPRIKRITNLTAANAGQTIVFTVNSIDASGSVDFDCWWIEAKNPPPVIIMDIVRLNALGYSGFAQMSGNTESTNDGHVNTWNAAIYSLVNEFDSMVQIAYCDAAINKDASLLWSVDGVHPNEHGSAKLADAIYQAVKRLQPPGNLGPAAYINSPAPRAGQVIRLHRTGINAWYTADVRGIGGTAYTGVAGDVWALPVQITNARARINMFAIEVTTASATTAATIRWGLYDDPGQSGYPFSLMHELTSAGAFSVGTTTGVKTSPASGTGSIDKPLDPGVFWLVFKVITIGSAAAAYRTLQGPNLLMPNLSTTGAPLSATTMPVAYKLTGQGTTALPSKFPSGAALSDNCPYIGFRLT